MAKNFGKAAIAVLIGLSVVSTLGCSAETDKSTAPAPSAATSAAPVTNVTDGKSVGDAILAQIIPGIEGAFRRRNAKARWQGTTLHVAMDGDATPAMAGWSDCRVISHLLKDGQTSVLEFPNGTLQCTEVLKAR